MTPKLDKDSTKKLKPIPLTGFDEKILSNTLANRIQQCIKCYTP